MRLSQPFFQLPVLFEAGRLQAELAALPADAWVAHPDGVPGNSAARLISAGGGETDAVYGRMLPTRWLAAMPYLRQVLARFGVVWGRSRLMRLAPGARVPEHADVAYHWHTRVRLHIPIVTWPQVRFHCDGQTVHMAAGEAWIFDNWRPHHVENAADAERIHLVADTTGTAAFWGFACGQAPPRAMWRTMPWDPATKLSLLTESNQRSVVMPAAEVQLLLMDFQAELSAAADTAESIAQIARFRVLRDNFVFDWRQLCLLHGVDGQATGDYRNLVDAFRAAARLLATGLVMRTNGTSASFVLETRILQHLLVDDGGDLDAAPLLRTLPGHG